MRLLGGHTAAQHPPRKTSQETLEALLAYLRDLEALRVAVVAGFAALSHGFERSHPPICLHALPIQSEEVAGRLCSPLQNRTPTI